MSVDQLRFQQILEAARQRIAPEGVDTMVVSAHLSQMRLFMVRGGVEWFARQDSYGHRREFIRRVVEYNELLGRLEAIADNFLIDGSGLFYFRPSKDLYRIHYFPKEQFRTYYDEEGALEEVVIIYSFKVRPPRGFGTGLDTSRLSAGLQGSGTPGELRWVRLRVRMDAIEQSISAAKPDFESEYVEGNQKTVLANTLGFIPAVEVFNNRGISGSVGSGEFDWMATHILQHDRMTRAIKENLRFFGHPTLVSSRPRHDLIEPDGDDGSSKKTVSTQSGFMGLNLRSSRVSEPAPYSGSGLRVPRIIANLEAADRVQFITPDAVSGDLTLYTQRYMEMIRAALGGVDDLSISSGATAYEVRTLFGRVAATASRKCRELFGYGLARLFSLMLYHEERIFRESLARALGIEKPEPVLREALDNPTDEQVEALEQRYDEQLKQWNIRVSEAVERVRETGELPSSVVGLIPDGSLAVEWRWTGEVFEDSPQELLQKSIVCRNLQELGVGSIEALAHLFPEKTPEERMAMLSGYPFRMVEATQRSIGIFGDLQRAFFQVPHPQEPDLPLAADPNLDLVPYLYRTLDFLRQELSYQGTNFDVDPAILPPTLSDADRIRAADGQSTGVDADRNRRRAAAYQSRIDRAWAGMAGGSPAVLPGSPMAAGVQPAGRQPDTAAPLPGLGGTLSFDPTRADFGAGGQLGLAGVDAFTGGLGAPDLAAPSNAGLFPAGPAGAGEQRGGRNGRAAAGAGAAAGPAGAAGRRRPARSQ